MSWDVPFVARYAGEDVLVAEWCCPGSARPPSREVAKYFELDFLRYGAHVRTSLRTRRVIAPTRVAVQKPGDEYWMKTAAPQRATIMFLRTELPLHERVYEISATTARTHAALTRALDPFAVEELSLLLVSGVLADARVQPPRAEVTPAARRLADDMQHVIATRFRERLSVTEIARASGASPFHASRVFRAVTGRTLHAQLTRTRLWASLFELRHGELSDVAYAVGFSSHSHFASVFHEEFGVPPSRVR